jgi:hypothetical protein
VIESWNMYLCSYVYKCSYRQCYVLLTTCFYNTTFKIKQIIYSLSVIPPRGKILGAHLEDNTQNFKKLEYLYNLHIHWSATMLAFITNSSCVNLFYHDHTVQWLKMALKCLSVNTPLRFIKHKVQHMFLASWITYSYVHIQSSCDTWFHMSVK